MTDPDATNISSAPPVERRLLEEAERRRAARRDPARATPGLWHWVRFGDWAPDAMPPAHDRGLADAVDALNRAIGRHRPAVVLRAGTRLVLVGPAGTDRAEWVEPERVVRPLFGTEIADHLRGEPTRRERRVTDEPERA